MLGSIHGKQPSRNFEPYAFKVAGSTSRLSNPSAYFDTNGNLVMVKFDEYYISSSGGFKKQSWLLKSFANQMTIKDFEAKIKSTKSTVSDYYST
jgi:hypothetical protein